MSGQSLNVSVHVRLWSDYFNNTLKVGQDGDGVEDNKMYWSRRWALAVC